MEMPMARIETIDAGFYRIPLPVILSDSTHGEIKAFELLTLRVRDSDGAEGVGYTYTVGRNGGAIADRPDICDAADLELFVHDDAATFLHAGQAS